RILRGERMSEIDRRELERLIKVVLALECRHWHGIAGHDLRKTGAIEPGTRRKEIFDRPHVVETFAQPFCEAYVEHAEVDQNHEIGFRLRNVLRGLDTGC